ncbi:MAG: hypothetical protein CMH54_07685 [Myxococcales bacterium]|nr:hypothetical protein [Myxococcales bacterium]|tara:strand:- start:2659 stop:3516 length:858 start_codon:yes stop_codon:yes gene_type:complete
MISVVSSAIRRVLLPALVCCALVGFSSTAVYALDVQPEGFIDVNGGQAFTDQDAFGFFVQDLADILTSGPTSSGSTIGGLGLRLSASGGVALIQSDSEAWTRGNGDKESLVALMDIRFCKGLPWAFELGSQISHIPGSNLWSLGVELSNSVTEGISALPDIKVTVGTTTTAGEEAINLTTVHGRLTASKGFIVGGWGRIEPFFGYQFVFLQASTRRVVAFEQQSDGFGGTISVGDPVEGLLPNSTGSIHRGFVGVSLRTGRFSIAAYGTGSSRVGKTGLTLSLNY